MEIDQLSELIRQVKKYNLEEEFDTTEDFDKWLNGLTLKQIKNFNSLKVDPSEIEFPMYLLIDENLLNCDDYLNRVEAMLRLKNANGWYHLFDGLCFPNFLNSKNYYEDMEMISKAPSAKYPLWIIADDVFINSPYHKEDLKLIVEAKDIPMGDDKELDWLVAEALTEVASNAYSINSPYHQKDMQLIAYSGSKCLQMSSAYPERGLNKLATNSVSLKDKYHLENMQILAQSPISSKYLYKLMTNSEIINGQYYRDEVNVLVNAKSFLKSAAMYSYIANPKGIMPKEYHSSLWDLGFNFEDTLELKRQNSIKGSNNPKYFEYLQLLNQIDDKYVLFVESLLSNKDFATSKYCDYDLNVLLNTQDKDIFIDLYRFMSNKTALESDCHIKDLDLISKTDNDHIRYELIVKATSKNSINSSYHDYDMKYISKLDWDNLDNDSYSSMLYYFYNDDGVNHPNHVEKLESLLKEEKESAVLSRVRKMFKNNN